MIHLRKLEKESQFRNAPEGLVPIFRAVWVILVLVHTSSSASSTVALKETGKLQINAQAELALWGWAASYLDVSLVRDVLQDDGLHGEDVGELHLRDVERTHYMGPAWQKKRPL